MKENNSKQLKIKFFILFLSPWSEVFSLERIVTVSQISFVGLVNGFIYRFISITSYLNWFWLLARLYSRSFSRLVVHNF